MLAKDNLRSQLDNSHINLFIQIRIINDTTTVIPMPLRANGREPCILQSGKKNNALINIFYHNANIMRSRN
jgi:hypothetical protein